MAEDESTALMDAVVMINGNLALDRVPVPTPGPGEPGLELARRQEDIAFAEAAVVPYWAPHPTSIGGHRTAAKALRSEADRFLEGS